MTYARVEDIRDHLRGDDAAWDDPDRSLIDGGIVPAPELDLRLLRSWGPWLADYAAMKSAPVGYAVGALLAAAGACIGAARKVRGRAGWESYPALWVLNVGPPSAMKSPVLTPITNAVQEIEREEGGDFDLIRRAFETKRQAAKETLAAWEGEVKAALSAKNIAPLKPEEADEPEEPKPPRIVVNDATIEVMAPILKRNPRGVILVRDELSAFIGNIGKYGGNGDAGYWLERYEGLPFSTDRVKGGLVQGDIGLVSIVGGIQPERLAELLFDRPDDGFVSRMLMIYPAPVFRVWETPIADMTVLARALSKLRSLPADMDGERMVPRVIPLAVDAQNEFKPWWQENGEEGNASTGFRAGTLGKAPGVVLRLALILEHLEWAVVGGAEPVTVSAASIAAAIGLYESYFLPSACRVFGGAARDKTDLGAAMLAKQIARRGQRSVNAKTIYREWRLPGLTTAKAVNEALVRLMEAGWVRRAPPARPGRPPNDWEVNPLLWEAAS